MGLALLQTGISAVPCNELEPDVAFTVVEESRFESKNEAHVSQHRQWWTVLMILAALTLEGPISQAASGSEDARDVVKRGTMEVGVATGFWQATTLLGDARSQNRSAAFVLPRDSLSRTRSGPDGGGAMSKCSRSHYSPGLLNPLRQRRPEGRWSSNITSCRLDGGCPSGMPEPG